MVADCTGRSGVTQSVDGLEQLGLVSPSDDRRLVLTAIAPQGLALVAIGHQVIDALAPRFITEPLTKSLAVASAAALAEVADGQPM